MDELNLLIKSSKIDLKKTNVLVKEEDTELTLKGIPFTILISKGTITQEIGSEFIVKRVENNFEKNKEKIALIKSKIKVKQFDIGKNVDTSNDAKTILAIKNQLKVENPLLNDEDLLKIDDNITFLDPNKKTPVNLIISIGSQSDIVKIWIERDYSDLESVNFSKNQLEGFSQKEITVSATSGTITDNKDLIVKTLKENYRFSLILGKYRTNISVKEENTRLTLEGVSFTILISRGVVTKKVDSRYTVKRSKTIQEKNKDKVAKIKSKIVNKKLKIGKNVNTSNDATILLAIKNQLKIQNPLLNDEEISKINDNIVSLDPEKRTPVILTILVGAESDIVKIWIERALSDTESINAIKNELENLVLKEITISAVSGTINDHKIDIFNALNSLINSLNIDLKETIISIRNENTKLTLNGVFFTILISKGNITQEITDWKVKRSKTIQEKNQDKVNAIKNKIVDKDLIINKDVDTSNDAKILLAIKNQLKIQNPLLNDEEISKIDDNISSLTLGAKTNVILTISVGDQSDNISVWVNKSLNDLESINVIKNKIVSKDLIINKDVDTSNDAKILLAIKNQLKNQNPLLNDEDLAKITDSIDSLIPGVKTNVVLTISFGTESNNINIKVTKSSNDFELVNEVKNAFEKVSSKEVTIITTSGTITDKKNYILKGLNLLIGLWNINLKGTTISIKEENTELTLNGIPFTILISKGDITQEITDWKVKRIKTTQEINNDKITTIKNKIVKKVLIINKDANTSNDAKILAAIKKQLKIENPLLSVEELSKITDNISSLVPEKITPVILTISVGDQFDNIKIQVTKPLTDFESVNAVKNELENLSQKIVTISATSGTITDNKEAIFNTLKLLIDYSKVDLKGTKLSIKEENTQLTSGKTPFTILISKGIVNQEIVSKFMVIRIKSKQEINRDQINLIKVKIINKNLIIDKNVDPADDAKILAAIKEQLKVENPSLNNDNLSKITDNITSLVPGVKTNVILAISIGSESDTVNIEVTKPSTDLETINEVKNAFARLSQKSTVIVNGGTITSNKKIITKALDLIIKVSNIDLKGTNVSIKEEDTRITLNGVFITILISKKTITEETVLKAIVVKIKSTQEIKNKIINKELIINKNVDTSDDAKTLLAIKNQLKIENPLLNDQDLLKITDNITSLNPEVKTNVILTISVNSESDTVNIQVTRPLSDLESINAVKNTFSKISQRIIIRITSGTITDNKEAVKNALNRLINSLSLDLKGTKVSIKEENTQITSDGQYVKILISKGDVTKETILKAIAVIKKST